MYINIDFREDILKTLILNLYKILIQLIKLNMSSEIT